MSAKPVTRTPRAKIEKPVRVSRRAPVVLDEDDIEDDDEPSDKTSARANKAPEPAIRTRVALKGANIGRGGRGVRSEGGRENTGRHSAARTAQAEFTEAEIREFMKEEETVLPFVPDTKEWHFKWTRVKIAGKDDSANIVAALNGKMGYHMVKGPEMLPAGVDLSAMSVRDGDFQGAYQYNDAILFRCPVRNFKLANIAGERRARALERMLDAGSQAGFVPGETRTGIVVEDNIERSGVREEIPAGEFEDA